MATKYDKFVNKIVRTAWVKKWTVDFLSKLDKVESVDKDAIKSYCNQAKQEFETEIKNKSIQKSKDSELSPTAWKNSASTHMSQIRNAIKSWQQTITLDDTNSYEQQTKEGLVKQHLALLYMNYPSGFHKERQAPTEEKKQEQRRQLESIDCVDEYQNVIEDLLVSYDYREVTIGLIAATGRRPSEILSTAKFEQIGQFEVMFSGQLKVKGEDREPYPTFTLVESFKVCDALLRLRRMPEIKELKKKTLAEIDSGRNSTVNTKVVEYFSPLINPPHGEIQLSSKNLRASYAAIAIYLFCSWKQEPSQFIKERLGHIADATASNYQDYQVTDKQGKPQTRGAWVERISEDMGEVMQDIVNTRVRVTKAAKQTIDDQEFLPFSDQVSRMEELIRLAQVGKQFEQGKLVKEVIKVVEKPVGKVVEVNKNVETETTKAVETADKKPVKSSNKIEDMSNDELFGSNIPNSGHEKIKRAVAAVKVYNESQAEKKYWWSINSKVIKDLTNCRTEAVKRYLESEEGRLQVSDYNELHQLGYHHNRGRGSVKEVIKLF
ncbi:MAG: protelomerase family protein [Cyanobacteria bacterium J06629_18]